MHDEVTHMRDSYGKGINGWGIFEAVTSFGALACGLAAAAVLKFSGQKEPINLSALLAFIAAVCSGLQKLYDPREKVRKDWTGRSKNVSLLAQLNADPNFDPTMSTTKMNEIIEEHDQKYP